MRATCSYRLKGVPPSSDFVGFPSPIPASLNVFGAFGKLKEVEKDLCRPLDKNCRNLLALLDGLRKREVNEIPVLLVSRMVMGSGRQVFRFEYQGDNYSICQECFNGMEGLMTPTPPTQRESILPLPRQAVAAPANKFSSPTAALSVSQLKPRAIRGRKKY